MSSEGAPWEKSESYPMVFTVALDRLALTLFVSAYILTKNVASAFKHTGLLLLIHSVADWLIPDSRPEVHSIGTVRRKPSSIRSPTAAPRHA